MYPVTGVERAVGAILDLVVGAVRAQRGDALTLEHMKEYCRQACKIVAAIRPVPSQNASGLRHDSVVPPREVCAMLVLSRKAGERIVLGRSIVVEVLQIDASRVRLGIRAPSAVTVLRHELMEGEDGAIDSQTDVHRRVKQPQEDLP